MQNIQKMQMPVGAPIAHPHQSLKRTISQAGYKGYLEWNTEQCLEGRMCGKLLGGAEIGERRRKG